MKLTAFLIGAQKAVIDIPLPTEAQMAGNRYMKWEATVSTGYADVSSILNIDTHYFLASIPIVELRNELITTFLPNWATATTAEKQALVRWYVYPTTATTAELDALYTLAERNTFRDTIMRNLNTAPENLFSIWKDVTNGKFYRSYSDGDVTVKNEILTNSII